MNASPAPRLPVPIPPRAERVALALVPLALATVATPVHAQLWENCTPLATHTGNQAGAQLGWIGVRAGDVDGDGTQDYLITAPFHGANQGRLWVHSGAGGAQLHVKTGQGGETLGWSGSAVGELDGDGLDEFAAGAPGLAAGAGYVYRGSDGSVLFQATGEAVGDSFGSAVSEAGDVDGDGVPDVAFGAPTNDAAGNDAGRVYVHSGASGLRIRTIDGRAAGEQFGGGLAGVGDRNGDGVPDLMVGAVKGGNGTGRAYVVSGVDGATIWSLDGGSGSVAFSQFFLGPCGDVNADGTEDLFVSDFQHTGGTGRAFVYDGASSALLYTIDGEGPGDGFAIGRGWAGDVDGDGYDDLVFGHYLNSKGGSAAGRVSIFRGTDGSRLFSWTCSIPGTSLGFDAAGIGDLDGDGVTDFLLTGATQSGNRGVAYVVSSLDPQPPTNYCALAPNSVGGGTRMTYRLSTSIAANELRLRVADAPAGVQGVFFYGFAAVSKPFGAGTLCVGAPRYRLGPPVKTAANGSAVRALDFTQPPLGGPGAVLAGATAYFQFMHRDPSGPAGTLVTLSDGLQVTFCP